MRYITDRKRAMGPGSAHSGTSEHWQTIISAVSLLLLLPAFVFTVGPLIGAPYETVIETMSRPIPSLIALLTFAAGFLHFRHGAQVMIEDYSRGLTRKVLIIAVICVSYAAMGAAIYAVLHIAL